MPDLTLDLQTNAETFLLEAARHAAHGDPRSWVLAVADLAVALELMMKAILQREHWALVFDELKNASREKLATGDLRSVGFREALKRCRELVGITIDDADLRHLEHLYVLRNRVIHFRAHLNMEQTYANVAKGLNVFLHLHQQQAPNAELSCEIGKQLSGFDHYVKEGMRRIAPQIEVHERPPEPFRLCLECGQDALVLQQGGIKCLFCAATASPSLLALMYSENDYGECPQCALGHIGYVLPAKERLGFSVCVLCGFRPKW